MPKYRNLTLLQVQKLAQKTARKTPAKGRIIGLSGNLGSGKTTFAKAFAQALGIKSVKSPTFIVSQRYPFGKRFLYHLDFYRLKNTKDLEVLGIWETLSSGNVVLIEWIEKFPRIKRKCDLIITFKVPAFAYAAAGRKPDDKRDVTIQTN